MVRNLEFGHRMAVKKLQDSYCTVYLPETSNIQSNDIGPRCTIHSHVWIGEGVQIGSDVKIQSFTYIPNGVKIGNGVFLGPRVTFTNDKYPPSKSSSEWLVTVVGEGASIGAGAVILPGVSIGDGAVVGAGAVVTRNVEDKDTVAGNPARPIKRG